MRVYTILIISIFIFPISLKCQDFLNVPGRKYVSISGQYFSELKTIDFGYNKFINGVRGVNVKGRYLNSITGYTNLQAGLLSMNIFNKLFNISDDFYVYGICGVQGGYEYIKSTVESNQSNTFPVYGFSIGAFIEIKLIKNLSLTLSGDINNLWKSKVGNGYYTTRVGLNYYL